MTFNGNSDRVSTGRRAGLHIRPLNVEKGSKRFPTAEDLFPPQTATWRNNLIALSQRRNLLFVAYSHQIYVWEPSGSFQVLGNKPEMIITPVMKNPEGSGYITPHVPHSINNILVDDLGRDEVLLLVTDSGNVCGYRVEAIFSALQRAAESNQERPLDTSHVDPFFVEYVEASAWGLAIHKFARLIAVSANTGLVIVFAFALVNPASERLGDSNRSFDEEGDFTDYGQTWLDIKSNEHFSQLQRLMPNKHRKRNIRLTYTGHFTNIPSVGFLNSDLDPNGTWMVTTDIDNKLLVWKIWESLGPFNIYHFNDSTFKNFPEGLRHDTERGWTALALDPRTFRPVKSTQDACGGEPLYRQKDGHTVFDITKLNHQVPDASKLYSYFPPAVKAQAEQPVLPDIFEPDCCISGPNDVSRSAKHVTARDVIGDTVHMASEISQDLDGSPKPLIFGSSARPSESTDTFSHGDIDSDMQEDNTSEGSNGSDDSMGFDSPETGDGYSGLVTEDNGLPSQDEANFDGNDIPPPPVQGALPGQGPLTTAEFLQFALLEALGGDIPGVEEYFHDHIDDYADFDEDHNTDEDEEMDDIDDEGQPDGNGLPEARFPAYQVFDRMLRSVFPDDSGFYEHSETLMVPPLAPAPVQSNFPILHFSQTDIRLIPNPFAPQAKIVCGSPLRQPFTHPIVSIRACDRFNMVKYIPEHGIVIAASQKGRAAVIALTESEETGVAFRLDWIVPFESQEKYGDRPLLPLLGMSVSPVQGFEQPADVPFIPRGVDKDKDLTFHYQYANHDDTDSPQSTPTDASQRANPTRDEPTSKPTEPSTKTQIIPTTTTSSLPESTADQSQQQLTLPECHAWATHIYQPDESWRGWSPSRRYRLLLMYADHTVLSYEFWYDWSSTTDTGGSGDCDDDEYFVV